MNLESLAKSVPLVSDATITWTLEAIKSNLIMMCFPLDFLF